MNSRQLFKSRHSRTYFFPRTLKRIQIGRRASWTYPGFGESPQVMSRENSSSHTKEIFCILWSEDKNGVCISWVTWHLTRKWSLKRGMLQLKHEQIGFYRFKHLQIYSQATQWIPQNVFKWIQSNLAKCPRYIKKIYGPRFVSYHLGKPTSNVCSTNDYLNISCRDQKHINATQLM